MLVLGAFRTAPPGLGGRWTTAGFTATLGDGSVWRAFANSLLLSGATVVVSTALALYLAWLTTRTRTPLRWLVTPMMVLIFAVPPLFFTLSWAMVGEYPVGLLDKALEALFGAAPVNVQSWPGMIGVSVLGATAPEYLLLRGPVGALDRSLHEASLICGARRLRTFLRIELPMLAPTVLGVVILGFVLGLSLLTVPLLLGEPAGIFVLPTEIYRYIDGRTPADYAGASTISLLLVTLTLILVIAQWRLLGRRAFTSVGGRAYRHDPVDIGRWKWLGSTVIVLYGVFALLLPLGQLVLGSLEPYFGVYSHLTLSNYAAVLRAPGVRSAFATTLLVGVIAGFAASALAVWITLAARRSHSPLRRLPDLSVWLLWALPGVTLGLGMIWAYLSVPGFRKLYATEWIVLIALTVGTTPIAARAVSGPIAQISTELEEAARTAGASARRAILGILLPLILPSFLAGWFLCAIVSAGNLDIPILLASASNQTVPLVAYNLYDNGELAQAAAVFCLFIAAVAVLIGAGAAARAAAVAHRRG
ncbi:MAG TPA: ABC transporter permease subunit [Solirubrobacteraceae bacterium]|nr:ABC transporter permease subunit [Solirubrobacteraceae bacterium]